ncbi:MarR family transcriptional regulator [Fulvivirgaceae bacterium BMA10]|uniref:MarR family transcriptional regulator n=1 Tax=Splendidivirga corallicola TaxID=3051826 RepID=A0ABT8KXJ3_9BACT|nr:MarR family transcriptional regulator [Fulvivirgaceae bacterium BMA10]
MNDDLISRQVSDFHDQIIDLVKKYQFRDRNEILSCGISVSQCYILETLHHDGALTVGELAAKMYLSDSTITRVVDQLVKKGFVERQASEKDRRVHLNKITDAGEEVYQESWKNIFQSERMILENFQPEHREILIDFLKKLNKAVSQWHRQCKT